MDINIQKLHPDAVIPTYSKLGDAGMDLVCTEAKWVQSLHNGPYYVCKTGLAFEIPEGYVGLLFPRSSISKTSLSLCNAVGVLDSKQNLS